MAGDRALSGGEILRSGYTIEVLLPESIELQFRKWVARTPGATWPFWGGHITLVSRFVPEQGIRVIREKIRDVLADFVPFSVRLDKVITEPHWRRPHLYTVLLVGSEARDEGACTLFRLHKALTRALEPYKRDLFPEVSERAFVSHLSLTLGLPEEEARWLAQAARASGLVAEFTIRRIWMLEFSLPAEEQLQEYGNEIPSASWSFPLLGEATKG